MDDWKYRIGSNVWKNLINKECEAVAALPPREEWDGESHLVYTNTVRAEPSDGSAADMLGGSSPFWYCPLARGGGEPYSRSYLVFQTGRLFLVGATVGAVETLRDSLPAEDLPHHLVLLGWDEAHIEGLLLLRTFYPRENKWLTVWTSSWVWEETLRELSKRRRAGSGVVGELRALRLLPPEEAEVNLAGERKYSLRDKVVACSRPR